MSGKWHIHIGILIKTGNILEYIDNIQVLPYTIFGCSTLWFCRKHRHFIRRAWLYTLSSYAEYSYKLNIVRKYIQQLHNYSANLT